MFGRWFRRVGLLLGVMMLAATASAAAPHPSHRIIAVGDLHGDYSAWRAIARDAGLIGEDGHWTGGKAVLVQTGDVVDRGPDSLRIIQDFMRLQGEARRAGGKVVVLVGNHEAMNMTDDLRYVSAGDYAAFANGKSEALRDQVYEANKAAIQAAYRKRDPTMTDEAIKAAWIAQTPLGQIEHQRAWHPRGVIGRWVLGNPAAVIIDGNLFVHGGLSLAYAKTPLDQINRRVAAALKAGETNPASIINDPMGPLWYRGLIASAPAKASEEGAAPSAARTEADIEAEVDQVLSGYGATRMIIGHTPIITGIAILYGGKLARIDTGISAVYGGTVSYLEILDGALIPHTVARPAVSAPGAG